MRAAGIPLGQGADPAAGAVVSTGPEGEAAEGA